MSNYPTVSIIVIFYDAEKFLADALESVLAQTFQDWELLLADDGSSDGSSEIAKRYAAAHPDRIRYLEHDGHRNRGMSPTRNLGISHARGRYLSFLDADDVWLPYKLERQLRILEAHPKAAMTYGATCYWYGWTGAPEDAAKDHIRPLGVSSESLITPPTLLTLSLESTAPTPCPSDIMIRRETVEAVGGFEESFSDEYQLFEDQAFLSKIYIREPVFVSAENLFLYRQHEGSYVSAAARAERKHRVGLYYFGWLESYLKSRGVTDEKLWRALEKKRWRYRPPKLAAFSARIAQAEGVSKRLARQILPVAIYQWMRRRAGLRDNRSNQVSMEVHE